MKKKNKIIIIIILILLLLLAVIYIFISHNKDNRIELFLSKDAFITEVNGIKIQYPEKWKDIVSIKVDDTTAYFTCGNDKLFDITIGESSRGCFCGKLNNTAHSSVYVMTYSLDKKAKNYNNLCSMQEDVNVIIANLQKDYDLEMGCSENKDSAEYNKENNKTYNIKTKITNLEIKYPEKWQDKVDVSEDGNTLHFSCGNVALFDLCFGACDEGCLLGVFDNEIPIYIIEYSIDKNEKNYEELCNMQEDVNIILQNWINNERFELS